MEDSNFFNQYQMNPLDYTLEGLNFQSFSSESYYPESTINISGNPYIELPSDSGIERPTKQLKTNNWNSCTIDDITPKSSPSSSSQIISFDNSITSPATTQQIYGLEHSLNPKSEPVLSHGNLNFSSVISKGSPYEDQFRSPKSLQETKKVCSTTRNPINAQDHVIAERKRRENLNQLFIALSVLVPGLRKTDKASVLGDAIMYLKQLQERVKKLEEQATKKSMESMIIVKKSQICTNDEASSSDENSDSQSEQYLPEIEAIFSDRNVLIRIHCEKSKGRLVNILNEVGKLHLTVVNSNAFAFGNSTLDITVVAQMDSVFAMTVKDLVKNLRLALLQSMM